jgi:hypothetical protein
VSTFTWTRTSASLALRFGGERLGELHARESDVHVGAHQFCDMGDARCSQDENGGFDAGCAQLLRLSNISNAKVVHAGSLCRVSDGDRPVPVGVGLDREENLYALADAGAHHGDVLSQLLEVHDGLRHIRAHIEYQYKLSGGFSQESSTLLQKTNSRGGRDACPGFAWTVRLAAEGGKVYSPDEVW